MLHKILVSEISLGKAFKAQDQRLNVFKHDLKSLDLCRLHHLSYCISLLLIKNDKNVSVSVVRECRRVFVRYSFLWMNPKISLTDMSK